MLEPLQGEGGVHPGDLSYFQYVRQRCNDLGILLILDEIQTGIGRSGTFWEYQYLGVEPDILTVTKGLGGGIPIGATLCKEFCNVFEPGDRGSTFGGNPLACAVDLTVCQTLERDNLLSNVQQRGEQLRNGLKQIGDRPTRYIQDVRGWGLWQLDGGTSLVLQCWVAKLLESGAVERHLRRMRIHYRQKRDSIATYLRELFPEWSWQLPGGGMQFWIKLPPDQPADEIVNLAAERGVGLWSGAAYYVEEVKEANYYLVLGYGAVIVGKRYSVVS